MGPALSLVELKVGSIPELVSFALDTRKAVGRDHPLWFRGHACSSYSLTPTLMRQASSPEAMFDREKRLLTRFRQRSLPYWPAGYPQDDWEHLFAMQHHGAPTRLLDWSENLFVGTYFSVQEPTSHGGSAPHEPEDCRGVVWALDPLRWNRGIPQLKEFGEETRVLTTADEELAPYYPETALNRMRKRQNTPVAIYGTHNSDRIVAQRGTFTAAGNKVAPLESFASDIGSEPSLWRVELDFPRSVAAEGISALGFTETMIFPDLPALARELDASEGWI